VQRRDDRIGERRRIARGHEDAGAIVREHVRDAAHARGDDRPSAGEGLEDHVGRALQPAREHQQIARGHPLGDLLVRACAGDAYASAAPRTGAHSRHGGTIAHEHEASLDAAAHALEGVEQIEDPLALLEAPHEEEYTLLLRESEDVPRPRALGRPEERCVDAVVHEVDALARHADGFQLRSERP